MKARFLFFTLFTSISILLITNGFAFAGTISACRKHFQGTLYNVQIDAGEAHCLPGDSPIYWNQEGPPGQDGADGEQGPPGLPGGSQFILKDNNGIEVGPVITVNIGASNFIPAIPTIPFFEERSVLTALDVQKADASTVTVGVPAIQSGFQFQGRIVFENTDCAGTPRLRTDFFNLDFLPAFALSAVVGTPGQPEVRKLYVKANEAEEPTMRNSQSILIGDKCVSPTNFMAPSVTMELVNGQMHIDHPGPFTLEGPTGGGGNIHQVRLEDSNSATCEASPFPDLNNPDTFGWCPNSSDPQNPSPSDRFGFIIQDDAITANSVVIVSLVGQSIPTQCQVRAINPALKVFGLPCGPVLNGIPLNYAIINP